MKILTKNGLKTQTWQWTSNYRIWEANQKVFLYPENWLTPELKDDKSPLFEDLEKELLKSRISASHLS